MTFTFKEKQSRSEQQAGEAVKQTGEARLASELFFYAYVVSEAKHQQKMM
jgi:hypothetical protein